MSWWDAASFMGHKLQTICRIDSHTQLFLSTLLQYFSESTINITITVLSSVHCIYVLGGSSKWEVRRKQARKEKERVWARATCFWVHIASGHNQFVSEKNIKISKLFLKKSRFFFF